MKVADAEEEEKAREGDCLEGEPLDEDVAEGNDAPRSCGGSLPFDARPELELEEVDKQQAKEKGKACWLITGSLE